MDLYGARCGALHSYGTSSRLFREGQCRKVGYTDKNSPAVAYVPSINNSLVVVSIDAFADTFFNGVDKFLIDIYKDVDKAKVAEGRFDNIFHIYPMRSDSKKEGSV